MVFCVVRRPYFPRVESHDRFWGGEKPSGKVPGASASELTGPGGTARLETEVDSRGGVSTALGPRASIGWTARRVARGRGESVGNLSDPS